MTIKVYTFDKENNLVGTTTEKNIVAITYEDQREIDNGMWLHCVSANGKPFAIEFDPDSDTFLIFND